MSDWRKTLCESLMGICLVAIIFSVMIGGMTLLMQQQLRNDDPLNDDGLIELRTRYAEGVRDDATRQALRALDLAARKHYFQQRQRIVIGGCLALAGIILALGSWGLHQVIVKRPLAGAPPRCDGMQTIERANARQAVALTTFLLAALAMIAILSAHSPLDEGSKTEDGRRRAEDGGRRTEDGGRKAEAGGREAEVVQRWSPTFRGADGSGRSDYGNLPVEWHEAEGHNILWRHPLELPGWASPVVSGHRVIVSGADQQQRQVYCVDADSGERLWTTTVPEHPDATVGYKPDTTDERWDSLVYAGSTPAVSANRAFVLFSNGQLVSLDLTTGAVVWNQVPGGTASNLYGLENSLLIFENRVICVFEGDERFIASYDADTGRQIWQTPRTHASWASPVLATTDAGRTLVVLLTDPNVIAWDAQTGEIVWSQPVLRRKPDYAVGPSPVHVDGRVFVNCQNNGIYALSLTDGEILWQLEALPDRQGFSDGTSMVSDGRHLFQFYAFMLTCIHVETGEVVRQAEVDAYAGYASPALDQGKLYLFGDTLTLVIDADPANAFAVLGRGELDETIDATPAITDGRIYVRTDTALMAIGNE